MGFRALTEAAETETETETETVTETVTETPTETRQQANKHANGDANRDGNRGYSGNGGGVSDKNNRSAQWKGKTRQSLFEASKSP